MKYRIRYFAMLRERLEQTVDEVELGEGATGQELLDRVGEMYPSIADLLRFVRLASPDRYLKASDQLPSDIEILLIPPVSGG